MVVTSQPPHAARARIPSTVTNDRGAIDHLTRRLPATGQVRSPVRALSEASSRAVRSDNSSSQPQSSAPFDDMNSENDIGDNGHIGDLQAALACAGSQFSTDKIKLAANILPRAEFAKPKRMHSVGFIPRSRSTTLRIYLTDNSDERKYRLHRS